ncbi:MAG: bL12 family ribosomal protein [Candidatus Hodgkinia cicadicola]|nr:MAG: bL12 family ribosomal protein [Candidatus Hodgkinia cicadicola]
MDKVDEIAQLLLELKVSELAQLAILLEAKWGISTSAVTEPKASAVASKTCDVVLVKSGLNKIGVIKEIRSALALGLKEAKDFVDNVPKLIKSQLSEAEAGVLKSRFETLGAEIELR